MLIKEDGTVPSQLIELIRMNGLEVTDESPKAVNDLLQKEWVKTNTETKGILRHHIGGRGPAPSEWALLRILGFSEDIQINPRKEYDAVIFLGELMKAMARRLQFFHDQWYRKLGRDSCTLPFYLLAGDKPIDEKKEGRKAMPGIIKETGLELYPGWDDATWPTTEV